jgi:hypothetical protein
MPGGISGPQIVDKLTDFRHDQDALRGSVNNRRRIIQHSVLLVYSLTRQIPQEYVRRAPNHQFRRQRSDPTRPKPGSVDDDFDATAFGKGVDQPGGSLAVSRSAFNSHW